MDEPEPEQSHLDLEFVYFILRFKLYIIFYTVSLTFCSKQLLKALI